MNEYKFTDRNKKQCGYMRIVDETDTDSAELYFYGDICGSQWETLWEDKAPQDVADFLHSLDGKKKVDVYINSGGGDVFGGMAIYNILSRYQGETVAHIDGIAASIAGIIPFACDKVVAKSSAQIMLHKPWALCCGNADDMKKCIETLNTCEKSIIDIYAEHAVNGTTPEKIKSMIDRETWLTCGEAQQYFNIEIEQGEPVQACISGMYDRYKHKPDTVKNDTAKQKLQLELDMFRLKNNIK
jgi:ATP-dependent Clp endopeptidase proteolytic subunit ClpP